MPFSRRPTDRWTDQARAFFGDACVCDRSNRRCTTIRDFTPCTTRRLLAVGTRDYGKDMAHKRTADDLPGPAASRSCLTCATGGRCLRSVGGVIAVAFALFCCTLPLSPLVLLLRVPGDTHPRHHVIVHVSSDWVSFLGSFRFILSLDGDRSRL